MTDENVFKMMINQNSYLISSKHKNFNELIEKLLLNLTKDYFILNLIKIKVTELLKWLITKIIK